MEARINRQQKELFVLAAELEGRSLTDFVIKAVREAAERTIEQNQLMMLTVRDQRAFVDALLNAPTPNARLRDAAERYKNKIG